MELHTSPVNRQLTKMVKFMVPRGLELQSEVLVITVDGEFERDHMEAVLKQYEAPLLSIRTESPSPSDSLELKGALIPLNPGQWHETVINPLGSFTETISRDVKMRYWNLCQQDLDRFEVVVTRYASPATTNNKGSLIQVLEVADGQARIRTFDVEWEHNERWSPTCSMCAAGDQRIQMFLGHVANKVVLLGGENRVDSDESILPVADLSTSKQFFDFLFSYLEPAFRQAHVSRVTVYGSDGDTYHASV